LGDQVTQTYLKDKAKYSTVQFNEKTQARVRIMNRTFWSFPWIYDIIRLIMRSSFVSALREEKLRSKETQHIMYSQKQFIFCRTLNVYMSNSWKSLFLTSVSNNIPVSAHHSLWHFPTLAQKRLSISRHQLFGKKTYTTQ